MLQRRINGVAEFLAFIYWASLTLDFFGLRTPLIASAEEVLRAKSGNRFIGTTTHLFCDDLGCFRRLALSCVFFWTKISIAIGVNLPPLR
jgi:hypothetical protein